MLLKSAFENGYEIAGIECNPSKLAFEIQMVVVIATGVKRRKAIGAGIITVQVLVDG